ncbi:protease modulator HflC [Sedimentibacter sp. zth1]|uniref:protease modulator HflC n=1 Tax=Sedimentibacter sp. zth1 TaxID=2816908 RepID=UPI001A92C225|nr:protease modulator HflC [Sedimentibacter sp. zth1]QSX06123.1 protease modulator HflC [Sedimentibacter sp. zth1]
MKKQLKWIFLILFILIVIVTGFTFTVREGSCAIVTRFGEIKDIYIESGLHFKLPAPIDKVIVYDKRNQYMDSGFTETLTNDKINIILQTYLVWNISDTEKYYTSVENTFVAQKHLNDLVANIKNSVLGNYKLSALVSTDLESIKINEISKQIEKQVSTAALENYGINISTLKIKRLALPSANIQSVFDQMIADRQKYVSKFISEGNRDAAIIEGQANADAAEILSNGQIEAAQIDAETEKQIAQLYGEAYDKNSELFIFLKKLIALENSVNPNTVIIMRQEDSPFDIIENLN